VCRYDELGEEIFQEEEHELGDDDVTPGFKGKSECKNTCAPGSSYTHASTQCIPKHSVKAYREH
jgi:hypothetical protein